MSRRAWLAGAIPLIALLVIFTMAVPSEPDEAHPLIQALVPTAILGIPLAAAAMTVARRFELAAAGADWPARLLSVATTGLDGAGEEWGRAMRSELASIEESRPPPSESGSNVTGALHCRSSGGSARLGDAARSIASSLLRATAGRRLLGCRSSGYQNMITSAAAVASAAHTQPRRVRPIVRRGSRSSPLRGPRCLCAEAGARVALDGSSIHVHPSR